MGEQEDSAALPVLPRGVEGQLWAVVAQWAHRGFVV